MNKEERQFAMALAAISLLAGFEGNIAAAALWSPTPLSSYQWTITLSSILIFIVLFFGILRLGARGVAKH